MSAEGRVENQKLNQTAALLSFGWVFGFQLDLLEKNLITLPELTFTPYLRKNPWMYSMFFLWEVFFTCLSTLVKNRLDDEVLNINQRVYLPKAELNTKNEP